MWMSRSSLAKDCWTILYTTLAVDKGITILGFPIPSIEANGEVQIQVSLKEHILKEAT
jgi:hypothetical protein